MPAVRNISLSLNGEGRQGLSNCQIKNIRYKKLENNVHDEHRNE